MLFENQQPGISWQSLSVKNSCHQKNPNVSWHLEAVSIWLLNGWVAETNDLCVWFDICQGDDWHSLNYVFIWVTFALTRQMLCYNCGFGEWWRKWQPTPVFLSEKSMDRGAWWLVYAVAKSWRQLGKSGWRERMETSLVSPAGTLHSQSRVCRFDPWWGNWDPTCSTKSSHVTTKTQCNQINKF